MLQETITKDRPAGGWEEYVVPQCWESFTDEDHAVWDLLFARQVELLGIARGVAIPRRHRSAAAVASRRPRSGGAERDPRAAHRLAHGRGARAWSPTTSSSPCSASACSRSATSSARASSSIISKRPTASMTCSATSRCWRTTISPRWPSMSDGSGTAAIAAGEGRPGGAPLLAQRRVRPGAGGGELKILGAGLASSFGESHFSLESEEVERLPFSVERAVHTPYGTTPSSRAIWCPARSEQTIADVSL